MSDPERLEEFVRSWLAGRRIAKERAQLGHSAPLGSPKPKPSIFRPAERRLQQFQQKIGKYKDNSGIHTGSIAKRVDDGGGLSAAGQRAGSVTKGQFDKGGGASVNKAADRLRRMRQKAGTAAAPSTSRKTASAASKLRSMGGKEQAQKVGARASAYTRGRVAGVSHDVGSAASGAVKSVGDRWNAANPSTRRNLKIGGAVAGAAAVGYAANKLRRARQERRQRAMRTI